MQITSFPNYVMRAEMTVLTASKKCKFFIQNSFLVAWLNFDGYYAVTMMTMFIDLHS